MIIIGDIGGQMGLFIGGSILTLLEVFDYFFDVIKVSNEEHSNKSEKSNTNGFQF